MPSPTAPPAVVRPELTVLAEDVRNVQTHDKGERRLMPMALSKAELTASCRNARNEVPVCKIHAIGERWKLEKPW